MYKEDANKQSNLSFLKEGFSFMEDDRLVKIYTLMNEGFYLGLAIVLSDFNIEAKRIKELRKSRKEELRLNVQDLIGQDKLDAISSFAISRWECGEDKILARKYSRMMDRRKNKEVIAIE